MDAGQSADMFEHLEKQNEVLMETYRTMSHELHRLQVEEEVLLRKLYEVMSAEGRLNKETKGQKDSSWRTGVATQEHKSPETQEY